MYALWRVRLDENRADITDFSQNKIQTSYFIGTISHKHVNLTLVNTVNFEEKSTVSHLCVTSLYPNRHITRNHFRRMFFMSTNR